MKTVFRFGLLLWIASMLSGCIAPTMYVDRTLPPASKADVVSPAAPAPVQVLFEFQTKASPNARATASTRDRVMTVIRDSGLFSSISEEPQANQRRLTITINNFPLTDDAASKGFGVGLTFGLVGTTVTDGYECKAILSVPGAPPMEFQYKHALHTTIGNTSPPPGMTPEPSVEEAITKMIQQLVWSIMRDISKSKAL
ncbi:MAG: hypothetical protein JNM79_04185 [Burkholderiales bacterium]|nr:hypothetical protein [Burkholderiales bacterium]